MTDKAAARPPYELNPQPCRRNCSKQNNILLKIGGGEKSSPLTIKAHLLNLYLLPFTLVAINFTVKSLKIVTVFHSFQLLKYNILCGDNF